MSDYEQPKPADLVDVASILKTEESATYGELIGVDIPLEQLAELWLMMVAYQRAAKNVVDVLAGELGVQLEEHGKGVTVLEEYVMYKTKKSSRIKDAEGFWEFMKANPELLEVGFNPNAMRKTGIPSSVFDTFYEVAETPKPFVQSVPTHVIERNKQRKEQANG